MYGWLDLEVARQRREDLLREAHEHRMAHSAARAVEAGAGRTAFVRQLLRSVWPAGSSGIATTQGPGEHVSGCSAD